MIFRKGRTREVSLFWRSFLDIYPKEEGMLKTVKVSEETFNSLRSLQFALEQRTRKSISKGTLIEILVGRYIFEGKETKVTDGENPPTI